MAPPETEPFRAEFQRRIGVWRAALLGVPSPSTEAPSPGAPKVTVDLLTPGAQAAFELRRPQAQLWQPIIIGGFASFYALMIGAPFGAPGVLTDFGTVFGGSIV